MSITLSANQISAVEGCPRAMQFRFGARLRSGGESSNLTIGSAFHAAMAAHYHNQVNAPAPIDPWSQIDIEVAKRSTMTDTETMENLSREVKRLYFWYTDAQQPDNGVAADVRDSIQPVQIEVLFKLPLAADIEIVGIVDMLNNFHRSPGMQGKAITDHKTSQRGGTSFSSGLQYDPQALIYSWAARECGWTADWFCWNVTVKTQKPYLMRIYEPVFWPRVDMYMARARQFAEWVAKQPSKIIDILQMPGNPGQCRHCLFTLLCDHPGQAEQLASTEFRSEDYKNFFKFRTLPGVK